MKHPLPPVALWYAAAIVLAGQVQAPLIPLFAATLAWGLLGLFCSGARRVLLPAFLFFAGWLNLGWRQAVLSPHDLRDLAGERAQQVTLRGTITGVPSPRVLVRGPFDGLAGRFVFTTEGRVQARKSPLKEEVGKVLVNTIHGWVTAGCKILVANVIAQT